MPRKSFRKKKPAGRRPRRKPAYKSMLGAGAKALDYVPGVVGRSLRLVRSMINVEKHYADVGSNTAITSTGATFSHLCNGIGTGDDFNSRTGRSILSKSLQVKYSLNIHASAVNTWVHWAIVVDKNPDSATACSHDAVYGASSTYLSMIDRANEGDRFVILRQYDTKLDNKASPTVVGTDYIDLSNIHCLYDGTGATIASIEKNAIFVVAVSNEPTNTPTLTLNTRYSWFDN